MLHNPEPDILSDILSALKELGPFIRYSKAIQAMEDDRPPEHGFILTFDDGYKQNMTLLDVLDDYDCKAMFFLNTAPIDEMSPAWFMNPDKDFRSLKKDLKKLTYDKFLTAIDESGLTEPCSLRGRFGLTSGEVGNLLSRGHEIGVHTQNHPFLTQLQCKEMGEEITQCWTHLRHMMDCPSLPLHFAYPDGDYDERVVDFLEAMGVRSAVTIEPGPIREPVRLLTLPRTCMDDTDYAGYALFKLTGPYRFFHRMAKKRGTKQANHAHT
jgi:peptidoglycan/xylan/chitin deacetylase (PgdA/CDA1 family)